MSTGAFIGGIVFLIAYLSLGLWFIHMAGQHRLNDIQQQLGQRVTTGLFRHTLLEMSAILRHDGEEFQEADLLMDAANAEPKIAMSAEADKRLRELMAEREVGSHPSMREGEQMVARAYPIMLDLARREDKSLVELSGITTVGTQAPAGQSAGDASARGKRH